MIAYLSYETAAMSLKCVDAYSSYDTTVMIATLVLVRCGCILELLRTAKRAKCRCILKPI